MAAPRIEGVGRGQLDHKRCYLPGITLIIPCGGCGLDVRQSFDNGESRYLIYPQMGEKFTHTVYHVCTDDERNEDRSGVPDDWETQIDLILDVKLRIA